MRAVDGTYTTEFNYDGADRLKTVTYPTGETVTQQYSTRGLPATLAGSDAGGLVTGTQYNVMGQITQIDLGNGASTLYEYWGIDHTDNDLPANSQFGKLWQITTQDASDSPVQQVRHSWDPGVEIRGHNTNLSSAECISAESRVHPPRPSGFTRGLRLLY